MQCEIETINKMAIFINDNKEAKKSLLSTIKMTIGNLVTDINFEDSITKFVEKGGYDFSKTLKENVKDCIQYIAIRKAKLNI